MIETKKTVGAPTECLAFYEEFFQEDDSGGIFFIPSESPLFYILIIDFYFL